MCVCVCVCVIIEDFSTERKYVFMCQRSAMISLFSIKVAQSAGAIKYTDYISARPPPPTVLDMT